MKIIEKGDGVLIEFGRLNFRLWIFLFCWALASILFMAIGVGSFYVGLTRPLYSLLVVGPILFILGCANFWHSLRRIFRSEKMMITMDTITIINSTFLIRKKDTYYVADISSLNYMGRPYSPFKGNTYSKSIDQISNKGNLTFDYGNEIINFGKDVFSWDAEKISEIIYKMTFGRLSIGNLPDEINEEDVQDSFIAESNS